MLTLENQLIDQIEQDDRMTTVEAVRIIYPELAIKEVFEILEDPLLLETLIIEIALIPNSSIEGLPI